MNKYILSLAFSVALLGTSQTSNAAKHTYQCYSPGLCLGASFARTAQRFRKRGFKVIKRIQPLICRFYRPKGANIAKWPCRVLRKGQRQLFLIGHRQKLIFAYIGAGSQTPVVSALRKRWGLESQVLRSLEGLNLFWRAKQSGQAFGIGAFIPYIPGSKKKLATLRPKGVFLFQMKGLRRTPYGTNFAAILRIASYARRHRKWPRHCFHTLCLGASEKAALTLLKTQGYKRAKKRSFRACKQTFGASNIPNNKLRCLILVRPTSSTYLHLVWAHGKLIFVQGERLSPAPNLRTLRFVWGKEARKLWIRGMLFVQWLKPKGYRYLLSVPLYGDKASKKPLAIRRSVGFVLLDWKWVKGSKMGKTLKKLLKLP